MGIFSAVFPLLGAGCADAGDGRCDTACLAAADVARSLRSSVSKSCRVL